MGRCCIKGLVLSSAILFSVLYAGPALSRCLLADKYEKEGIAELEIMALNMCATQYNDDESQMKLADIYLNGLKGESKDELTALYMYQLAAEAGNTEAQVRLSQMLQSFDTSPERRAELKSYMKKLEKTYKGSNDFSGEIMHPYTLLLLASERADNKWYYPSSNRIASPQVSTLLSQYKITPEKRQAALQEASRWKTRKLLETAKEVLPEEEYGEFENKVKNASTRSEAMTELKKRMQDYIEGKNKERSLPL
ncbi:MAG: sel1 repeat family protein [Alphaproteobacteria bacterium]|nr:sel1 repeat family protein [Alphaproteobacteria bacterium]